jgi:hypothetical protein
VNSKLQIFAEHVGRTVKYFLHQLPAGRNLTVLPDDLFIVSYPKSGNTWTRFLIGNLIYENDPVSFANVESRIPSIYIFSDRQLLKLPRIFKSHDCCDPRYRNVIYIVRDPRDVIVSAYHYSIKVNIWPEDSPIEDFVAKFVSGSFHSGLLVDARWGNWYDNVSSWLALQHNRKFLLLRYEDMLEDPVRELRKLAAFLGKSPSTERLQQVVELSSARRMRELEQAQSKDWKLTQNTRQDKPFVRKATKETWREELPPDSVQLIESAWGDLMTRLGYELASPQTSRIEVGYGSSGT